MKLVPEIDALLARVRDMQNATAEGSPSALEGISKDIDGVAAGLEALRSKAADLQVKGGLLELIVTVKDVDLMIERAAALLKDWADVDAVGVRLREGDDFPYFATIGFPDSFVAAESSLISTDHHGHRVRTDDGKVVLECMCGNIISGRFDPGQDFFTEGGSFWTNSTTELLRATSSLNRQGPTRNHCNAVGFESVALIPLRGNGDIFGLIQLNDYRCDRFTAEGIALLEDLASYVAAAIA